MRKKLLTVALAATMAVASVFSAFAETLTGTKWWEGMQAGQDYTLSGDGSISLDVNFKEGNDDGYGAFSVEVYNDGWFFTTGSDQNAWYAEGALNQGESISGVASEFASTIAAGTTYKITVTRSGSNVTVTYANPDGSKYAEYVGTNTSTPDSLKIHVMAQIGTYEVTESAATPADPTTDPTTEAKNPGQQETTATPAGNKDNVTPSKTGDSAAVAVVAIVALGAAVAVVASKKKVTE